MASKRTHEDEDQQKLNVPEAGSFERIAVTDIATHFALGELRQVLEMERTVELRWGE